MIDIELVLFVMSSLVLGCVLLAHFAQNLGLPTLLLFITIGMLAGSEGPGGIQFNNFELAQAIGITALSFILFSGGLDTRWKEVKTVLWPSVGMSTAGVILTAVFVASLAYFVFDFSLLISFLLGAVISSTDAAAVFSILGQQNTVLKPGIRRVLEFESGSNDPMAVFLTIGAIALITSPETSIYQLPLMFLFQMGIGGLMGFALGHFMVYTINRIRFPYEGIYPVFALAFAALIYALPSIAGGSGFLSVYIAALVVGNSEFIHKRSLMRFFDGMAWLSQILMFLTLGLLVFPSDLLQVTWNGILLSLFLIFIARPLSTFMTLAFTGFNFREKLFLSWVGLRGAIPIILATFPFIAGIDQAYEIFNLVFFVVITSTLIQGWSLPKVARWLGVLETKKAEFSGPIEFSPEQRVDTHVIDLTLQPWSNAVGQTIIQLGMPKDALIILIYRNGRYIVPGGGTILESGDHLQVIVNKDNEALVRKVLTGKKETVPKKTESDEA